MDGINRRDFSEFKASRRKVVRLSQEDLVKMDYLDTEKHFPLVMEPQTLHLIWRPGPRTIANSSNVNYWSEARCFFAASRLRAFLNLNNWPARSPASYWIIVNERPLAEKLPRAFIPQPNFLLINLFLCTMRCLTLTTGRRRSGSFARSRRSKAEVHRLPMIERSST